MSINQNPTVALETGPAISPLKSGRKVESLEAAGQWTLIRQRFFRHKVAAFAAGIILLLYLIGAFAEFLAPEPCRIRRARNTPLHRLSASPCLHRLPMVARNFCPM